MQESLGEGYEPCPVLLEKVDAGDYGKKTGHGFYDYEGDGVEIPIDAGSKEIATRLVGIAVNEAAKLFADDVSVPDDIDKAVMLEAGFPEGSVAMASDLGYERVHETLPCREDERGAVRSVADARRVGGGGRPDAVDTAADGDADFETIRLEYPEEGATHLILNRPDNLNSVNTTVLEELDEAMDPVETDDDTRALLVKGAGEAAFCGPI
jgi:enoyl-CoA hydratase/3-hydroxyacyl-CoA dehydrogenase